MRRLSEAKITRKIQKSLFQAAPEGNTVGLEVMKEDSIADHVTGIW